MRVCNTLPGSLSLAEGASGLYIPTGFGYDYAIGGLPFLSGASREYPSIRETAPQQKQQFDSSATPGEQSLGSWWLRSQQSFHGGAGLVFADPTTASALELIRFRTSRNVDVWTQGQVSLLNSVKTANATPVVGVTSITEITFGDGTAAALAVGASTLTTVLASGVVQATFTPSAKTLQTVTSDGTYVYVGTADGIWSAPMPATSSTGFTWTLEYTISTGTDQVVYLAYVKQRLMLGVGPKVYELPPHPSSHVLPASAFEHPDAGFRFTGFTEVSAAILAVGNAISRGAIIRFILNTDGTIPTLNAGAVVLQLPSGEVPHSAFGYLGAYVAIGTNKGVRIASSDETGSLTYGPLLFETEAPVRSWSANDTFLWCTVSRGIDGDSGLYRIDLSTQVAELRFAYATDLNVDDITDCNVVAHLGSTDLMVFATAADLYIEDSANLALSGYLQTGRVRFGTLEPKLFKLLTVRGPALLGPLSFTVLDQIDAESGSHTFALAVSPGDEDVMIAHPTGPQDFVSIKFTLQRGVVTTTGAQFTAYQLKALPSTRRQRMIQLPLLCYDWETDSAGNRIGGELTAITRLMALENLDSASEAVVLQDFSAGTQVNCIIEQVRFVQTGPPPSTQGWGGLIVLTLRTI